MKVEKLKIRIILIIISIVFFISLLFRPSGIVLAGTPTPSLLTVTDTPDPQRGGLNITFNCTNCEAAGSDTIKLYVCNQSDCFNCGRNRTYPSIVTFASDTTAAAQVDPQNTNDTELGAGTENYTETTFGYIELNDTSSTAAYHANWTWDFGSVKTGQFRIKWYGRIEPPIAPGTHTVNLTLYGSSDGTTWTLERWINLTSPTINYTQVVTGDNIWDVFNGTYRYIRIMILSYAASVARVRVYVYTIHVSEEATGWCYAYSEQAVAQYPTATYTCPSCQSFTRTYYARACALQPTGSACNFTTGPNYYTCKKENGCSCSSDDECYSGCCQSNGLCGNDCTSPTYSLNSTNSTLAGTPVEHRLKWSDNVGLSGYIFSFMNGTNGTTIYNFSDTTNNKAWNNSDTSEPPTSLSLSGETELSSEAYTNISASDNNYFESISTDHPYHKFNITINESVNSIEQINISWEGHTTSTGTVNLYVYNFTAGSWGSALASNSGTTDFWLNVSLTSGFSDLIQNGKMSILVQDPNLTMSDQLTNQVNLETPFEVDTNSKVQSSKDAIDYSNPRIISASVEPSKVKPGDMMVVTAEVKDSFGIKSVKADTGGIETIDLKLKEGSVYQGIWSKDWLVHDTEVKEYITTITATNILGFSSQKEVKWRDDPGWLSGWDKRIKFTTDQTDIDADLSNFPILVYLSSSSGRNSDDVTAVFTEVGANSKKIAVTTSDGTTECYVEVEKWDSANQKAWLWIKAPSVSGTVDTDFYLYYDNDHADNTNYVGDKQSTPGQNVWDSSYGGVQHFDEASGTLYDSTSNNMDVTANGSPTYAADAQIYKGIRYAAEGASNRIDTSSAFDTQANDWTLEFWANYTQIADYQTIIWYQADTGGSWRELITVDSASNIKVWWQNGPSGGDTTVDMVWGAWTHWAFRYDDTAQKLYIYKNGVLQNAGGYSADLGNAGSQAKWAHFNRWDATGQGGQGTLDEWRFSTNLRSEAYVKASYETGRDDLLDFGSEEIADTTPPTYSLNSTNSTVAGTPVEHRLKWNDDTGLSGFIFSFDNCTGTFVNDTWNNTGWESNPTQAWSNVTKVINSTAGCTIRWRVYANDTWDNWNVSENYSYITTALENKVSTDFIEVKVKTGFVNETWVAFASEMCPTPYSECWSNVTKVVNSTVGATIKWKVYANDTSNNWNVSETYSYETTITEAPIISWENPTPANATTTSNDWVYLNTTITSPIGKNTSALFDWNYSLVGYWAMDWYNSTGIFDNSTYDNFGTFNGGLGTDNITTGRFGSALEFDGVDDYVETPITSTPLPITIEAWIKTTDDVGVIVTKPADFYFEVQSGKLSWYIASGWQQTSQSVNDNSWHHVAVSIPASGTGYLYIDGNQDKSFAASKYGTSSNKATIGKRVGYGDYPLAGIIDEVRIYNRALSPEEINASYNNGLYRLYHNFTSLSDGSYNYYAYAIDTEGNAEKTEVRTVTVAVPTDAAFTVAMPSSYTFYSITGTTEEAATFTPMNISFNFTSVPQTDCQPYSGPPFDGTNAQSGSQQPILLIDATGNVDINISLRLDVNPPSGITLYANCTCTGTCTSCQTTKTQLTTSYQQFVTGLAYSGNNYANITLWADVASGALPGENSVTLYTNSSA